MKEEPPVLYWPKLFGGWVWVDHRKSASPGYGNGMDNPCCDGDGASTAEGDETWK